LQHIAGESGHAAFNAAHSQADLGDP
jgi:hypothetical protein